jgi:hypothetical protein
MNGWMKEIKSGTGTTRTRRLFGTTAKDIPGTVNSRLRNMTMTMKGREPAAILNWDPILESPAKREGCLCSVAQAHYHQANMPLNMKVMTGRDRLTTIGKDPRMITGTGAINNIPAVRIENMTIMETAGIPAPTGGITMIPKIGGTDGLCIPKVARETTGIPARIPLTGITLPLQEVSMILNDEEPTSINPDGRIRTIMIIARSHTGRNIHKTPGRIWPGGPDLPTPILTL